MKREDLKALELADDVIDKIMALHGKDVEAHKTAAETAQAEVKGLKDQLGEANTTIEGFKKLDVDGIKAAADDWKAKAEKAEADGQAQVAQLRFDHALSAALTGAKAKNPAAVRALLKTDDLKLKDDGTLVGLDDQLKAIRESDAYLFEDEGETPRIVAGGKAPPAALSTFEAAARKGAGLVKE